MFTGVEYNIILSKTEGKLHCFKLIYKWIKLLNHC